MHHMIDLETFSTEYNSLIVSIGIAAFDASGIYALRHWPVDTPLELLYHFHIDPNTVKWWLTQSQEAQQSLLGSDNTVSSLEHALQEVKLFIEDSEGVWGNGATFDNVILRHAFNVVGIKKPWSHRIDRCYRTVKALHPKVNVLRYGIAHNAADDAQYQAEYLLELNRQFGVLTRFEQ